MWRAFRRPKQVKRRGVFKMRDSPYLCGLNDRLKTMEKAIISGIQQVGVGIPDVHEAWSWYRKAFGMDLPVFDEAAEAKLMLPYTGGKPRSRHAILACNLQGGGGMEIWQYTSRTPQPPTFEPTLGDHGIFVCKIKCKDVVAAHTEFLQQGLDVQGELGYDPLGNPHFFVKDPYGNLFQLEQSTNWFREGSFLTGGVFGCIIGVSDIEKARTLYTDVLGYEQVMYDREGVFADFEGLPGGDERCRRVMLTHREPRQGSFSKLFGPTRIELVSVPGKPARKLFEGRMWGDLGFIHLCFDISGMEAMRATCEAHGFPFTVDSSESFDMGEAAGHFSYIEDPDGTLIEFVETHKIPIIKKLGWYLDLRKRDPEKPLPDWMLGALRFNRKKD